MGLLRSGMQAADEAASAFDTLKAWVGVVVLFVVAAFFFVGPGELPDVLPQHRLIGIGGFVLAAVFLLVVLFGEAERGFARQVGARAKGLLYAGVFAAVGAIVGVGIGRSTIDAWQLSERGVERLADVGQWQHKFGRDGSSTVLHVISCEGFRATTELPSGVQQGDRVPVVFLPDRPSAFRVRPGATDFMSLLKAGEGGLAAPIAVAVVLVVVALGVLFNLWVLVAGPPAPPASS